MRLVILESPWQGGKPDNVAYLRRCIADCVRRGESPYASHRMLTEALDDLDPEDRALGIKAGFEWHKRADAQVVYTDLGISTGMQAGIEHARLVGIEVEYRQIGLGEPGVEKAIPELAREPEFR